MLTKYVLMSSVPVETKKRFGVECTDECHRNFLVSSVLDEWQSWYFECLVYPMSVYQDTLDV